MMILGKIIEATGGCDIKYCQSEEEEKQYKEQGYLPTTNIDFSSVECDNEHIVKVSHYVEDGEVKHKYELVANPNYSKQEVARLKAELSATDYQITKCYEASLCGEELPYDIQELHAERQAMRDRINELQNQ